MLKINIFVTLLFVAGCIIPPLTPETLSGPNFYILWSNTGEQTDFFVTSSLGPGINASDAWIAIGFSLLNETSNSNLVVCRNGPCNQTVNHYVTSGNAGEQPTLLDEYNPSLGLINTFVMADNGNLSCYFTRHNILLVDQYIPVNYNNTFVYFAFGGGEFYYNTTDQTTISNQTVNFPVDNSSNNSITLPPTTMIMNFTTMIMNFTTIEATTKKPPTVAVLIIQIIANIFQSIFG